jgi:hypothetical protein
MPSKEDRAAGRKNNPILLNLINSEGRMRHVRCFDVQYMETEIVTKSKKPTGRIRLETFQRPEWRLGSDAKNPTYIENRKQKADNASIPGEYHVPEDAPAIVNRPAVTHTEKLRDGTTVTRHPGDLSKEQPGEYNAWAHRHDPPDEEAMFKTKISIEAEFARQEGIRKYQAWKARRDRAQVFNERPGTDRGIGVGILPDRN